MLKIDENPVFVLLRDNYKITNKMLKIMILRGSSKRVPKSGKIVILAQKVPFLGLDFK